MRVGLVSDVPFIHSFIHPRIQQIPSVCRESTWEPGRQTPVLRELGVNEYK